MTVATSLLLTTDSYLADLENSDIFDCTGVVAIIPAYNEERFIASVVLTTKEYAQYVIVVDDGSSDRTAILAEQAGATVVRHGVNKGKAQALNSGFNAAKALLPRAIVCLDGDTQHDPKDIPTLVQPIFSGEADVVVGSRFLDVKSKIPAWRQVGQHALTLTTNVTSGVWVTDSQSGYRAFSPNALESLSFRTQGLSVESEMQFLFKNSGLVVKEAPIHVHYLDGNKRNPVVHGLQVLDAMLSLVARRRPIAFFCFPGFVLMITGLLLGMRILQIQQATQQFAVGSAILMAILLLGGAVAAVTGILLYSLQKLADRMHEDVVHTLEQRSLLAQK
ncbi:glycosyltransferase family 2 protein [Deinococcus yavapaiensis]|uniref:Glycosyl transferase family 2 n=1 Tax=Deinococcus yavapaiensis KR-236 TaxID=694435 RepID=A0A318S8X9_9DEIO|nr:glycosyltransferase family 2 protein [Deinococcus yavapaiensis]PYE55651.1 glycosyl transferase family 2 [Deinococcus yavapaiensis KR-236]